MKITSYSSKSQSRSRKWLAVFPVFVIVTFLAAGSVVGQESAPQAADVQANLASQLNAGDEERRRDALVRLGSLLATSPNSPQPQTVAALENVLQRDSSAVNRALAARVFELSPYEQSLPILLSSLNSEREIVVRKAIIYALARLRSTQSTPALIALLNDKKSEIRASAAFALAEIADSSSVNALIETLRKRDKKDEDAFARSQIVRGLGKIGRVEAVEPLLKALSQDQSQAVRREAAHALGSIDIQKDMRVIDALRAARTQKDPYLVITAENVLAKINARNP